MYCEKCGKKREQDELFCTECGNPYPRQNKEITPSSRPNPVLILGIISCIFITIPIIAIPLAITTIVLGIKNKYQISKIIPAIISLILSIIEIIIIIFLIIVFYNQIKNEDNNELFREYYDDNEYVEERFDIKGNKWLGEDNSILNLNQNNHYIWYQSDETKSNNYYEGTYQVYVGNEAITYIANNLPEYGLTEYNQHQNIINSNHSINEYYLIILFCEKIVVDGIEQHPTETVIYYYGFYEKEYDYLDLTDISTKEKFGFTREYLQDQMEISQNIPF